MRLALTVVSPATRFWADVVIDADPATPVADVAAELERLAYGAQGRVLRFPGPRGAGSIPLYVDFQPVGPQLTLAGSPIRNGSVISLGDPSGCLAPEPTGLVEIRVVGGPGAGGVHRISLGEADIGSGEVASIRVSDRSVPPLALHVSVDPGGGVQVTPHPGVQATLDREPLAGTVPWRPGQHIAVGDTLLGIAPYEPPDAALHPGEDGARIDFNRPPRLLPPVRADQVRAAESAEQAGPPAAARS